MTLSINRRMSPIYQMLISRARFVPAIRLAEASNGGESQCRLRPTNGARQLRYVHVNARWEESLLLASTAISMIPVESGSMKRRSA